MARGVYVHAEALRASFPEELLRPERCEESGTESVFGEEFLDQRHVDVRAIGATPPAELMYVPLAASKRAFRLEASRGVCIQPASRRPRPKTRPVASAQVVGTSCFRAQAESQEQAQGSGGEEGTFITAEEVPAPWRCSLGRFRDVEEGLDFNELRSEELERLCEQLESERARLEVRLAEHQEVWKLLEVTHNRIPL